MRFSVSPAHGSRHTRPPPAGTPFADRRAAGRELASQLTKYASRDDVVVLGLPRGGVPVAYEVAHALDAPLDVIAVRKLGVPGHEELAVAALAAGGAWVLNEEVAAAIGVDELLIETIARHQHAGLDRLELHYRGGRDPIGLEGRVAVVVDDGLATGATMRAAVRAARGRGAREIVVAAPVASRETRDDMRGVADEVVCLRLPEPLHAVGLWYADFRPTADDEVCTLLRLR